MNGNEWVKHAVDTRAFRHQHQHLHARFSRRLPASRRLLSFCIVNLPFRMALALHVAPQAPIGRRPAWPGLATAAPQSEASRRHLDSVPAHLLVGRGRFYRPPARPHARKDRKDRRCRVSRKGIMREGKGKKKGETGKDSQRQKRRKVGVFVHVLLLHRPASPGCEFGWNARP